MLLSPREKGLTSLFKEVRAFKVYGLSNVLPFTILAHVVILWQGLRLRPTVQGRLSAARAPMQKSENTNYCLLLSEGQGDTSVPRSNPLLARVFSRSLSLSKMSATLDSPAAAGARSCSSRTEGAELHCGYFGILGMMTDSDDMSVECEAVSWKKKAEDEETFRKKIEAWALAVLKDTCCKLGLRHRVVVLAGHCDRHMLSSAHVLTRAHSDIPVVSLLSLGFVVPYCAG